MYFTAMPSYAVIAGAIPSVWWTVLGALLLTAGDIAIRNWFATQWVGGFAVTWSLYSLSTVCVMFSFLEQNIAAGTVAVLTLNVLVYLLYAYFAFGDTLNTRQIIGIVCGIAALWFLETA
ncbi:MAG: hypothetical protein AB7G06_04120 [Bdellovibrionales bacterium]